MNNTLKKPLKAMALVLAAASATFVISLLAFRAYYGMDSDLYSEIGVYGEARRYISEHFVGEYDERALTEASIGAAVAALDDEWSYFMTAEEHVAYEERSDNRHRGVGISYIRVEDTDEIEITAVVAGSPAEEAGLLAGEIVTELNGESVAALDDDAIREMILENLGGTVTLAVMDAGGKVRMVEAASAEYTVRSVFYELLEGDIGYVKISNFGGSSGAGAIDAIDELIAQGATSLLFDVRNNPGGRVSELLELLDHILPEGEIFITADSGGYEDIRTSDASSVEMPMAVLVNASSFSAAEYFAAILQEYGWAEIVGEHTTGKGRSQSTIVLSDGSAIHISTARYFTPNRTDLSETGGIRPDYEVTHGTQADAQLQKAAERLSGTLS